MEKLYLHLLKFHRLDLSEYSGEVRPGSKPSSFAYVKTANVSVSACSE